MSFRKLILALSLGKCSSGPQLVKLFKEGTCLGIWSEQARQKSILEWPCRAQAQVFCVGTFMYLG